jgi:hypothetical protein
MLTSIDGFIADHGDAFVAAIRQGDFEALIAVLDPDVVLRADSGALPPPATQEVHGALAVAELATTFSHVARCSRPRSSTGWRDWSPRTRVANPTRPWASRSPTAGSSRSTSSPILNDSLVST